ncbi:MAG: hypothetical protein PHS80_00075 [Methanothrix sp.]|nr:hypothetical protein [Methanothrix sp.]
MTAIEFKVNDPEAPKLLINLFNTALPESGADLCVGVSVTGSGQAEYLNISFSSPASAVLSVKRTVGATTVSQKLNGGAAIVAGQLYQATILVAPGETINFGYAATTNVYNLIIAEVIQS